MKDRCQNNVVTFGDRGRKRSFAVVDMTDGTDVAVRFVPLKYFFLRRRSVHPSAANYRTNGDGILLAQYVVKASLQGNVVSLRKTEWTFKIKYKNDRSRDTHVYGLKISVQLSRRFIFGHCENKRTLLKTTIL